ncbi:hypothetical protein [Stutzerimonas degradans]|uniref:hypothetical protein n=1 Tax=Stutzerimonas degradans TaxID=2968968 RepID=UPI00158610D6|nr:hypothetical protein [Stutzerimonas degradans]MCQ4268387.1 hypothetical protein [Stutzerimonas degradans]
MMRIWRWPLVIGLLSLLGLLAGLVSDGAGDWLSWATLSLPVAIGAKALAGGRQPRRAG